MSKERECKDSYIVALKQRTQEGLRLTINSIKCSSSGKALMEYNRLVEENEDKKGQGLIVEMQLIYQGVRFETLHEKHI